ncbi:MAG: hypothetical protein IH598_02250 [Bacteroidales bacterium]|nr:hypothetical protein [Bacteroidales bacterium]
MKTIFVTMLLLLFGLNLSGQVSEGISYQTIIRDVNGEVMPNTNINLQLSIIRGTIDGEVVYTETHTLQTNSFGMVSLVIGSGIPQRNTFNNIQWGGSRHYFQIAIDLDGSENYQVIGTSQFVDVPYAINSKSLVLTDPKGNQWNVAIDTLGNLVPILTEWQCGFPYTDTRDGKTYTTINIGDQCWMTQNLNAGQLINSTTSQTNNGIIEKFCWDNLEEYCNTYGGLYQWNEMMQYAQGLRIQGICPPEDGWHLPDDSDWYELVYALGGEGISGGKMKSTGTLEQGTGLWSVPNLGATNQSGFSGLPAGFSSYGGIFLNLSFYAYFWSSDEFTVQNAWSRGLSYLGTTATRYPNDKEAGFSVRCVKSQSTQPQIPTVLTLPVYNITTTQATGGGEVTDDGNAAVTQRGLCWRAGAIPTIELNDGLVINGSGLGKYFSDMTGLESATQYTVRAFAQNNVGVAYGESLSFTTGTDGQPCPGMFTITDIEGNVYNTVLIGEQCWMKENIRTGLMITGSNTQTNNGFTEKYCYNNNPANCLAYGGLYQWGEMMQYNTTPGVKGICPQGWHIPNDDDWKMLEGSADSEYGLYHPVWNETGWRGMDAGKNLKSTSLWQSNGNGINLYGFRAIPAGYRTQNGSFTGLGAVAEFWSSSTSAEGTAWDRMLSYDQDKSGRFQSDSNGGRSVRCVRDAN